jgi:hypothetical protein
LNRPFDDQTQPRIRLEAEAIIMVFREIEAGAKEHCRKIKVTVFNPLRWMEE